MGLTISNITTYQNPELYRRVNGKWQKVDQQVHGNDFWQTEYNAADGTWDISYNVNLDSLDDEKDTAEFRFGK